MKRDTKFHHFGQISGNLIDFPEPKAPNKKKYSGVYQDKRSGKWVTRDSSGKKIYFSSEREAQDYRSAILKPSRALSITEQIECVRILDALYTEGYPLSTLGKAVDLFTEKHPEAKTTTLTKLITEWQAEKKLQGTKDITLSGTLSKLKPLLATHADTPITDFDHAELLSYCMDPNLQPVSQCNRITAVRGLFAYAVLTGRIHPSHNPASRLKKPKVVRKTEKTWPLNDIKTLFRFSLDNESTFHTTAHLLLGFYAGLRNNEIYQLRYCRDEIDIDAAEIYVPAEKSKIGVSRAFRMRPELAQGLEYLRDEGYIEDGQICANINHMRDFRTLLPLPTSEGGAGLPIVDPGGHPRKDNNGRTYITGPSAWHRNGLRNAFASANFKMMGAEKTAEMLGHQGKLDVFQRHYRRLMRDGEAEIFFAIFRQITSD